MKQDENKVTAENLTDEQIRCCFIASEANFNAHGMTRGDERAEIDRLGCKSAARWQIFYPPWSPDDATEACDAHKSLMTPHGGQAYPI